MSQRIRRRSVWLSIIVVISSCLVLLVQHQGWLIIAGHSLQANQPGLYSINKFVDGDTIIVNMNGHPETIRFIGVDTAETHKPNTPVQCFGPQAASYTKQRIGQQRVQLVSDPLSTNRDRYGRLLRYVYLPDGTNLNLELIRKGYGFYYPYFPYTKSASFSVAEQLAIAEHLGIWAKCHPIPTDSGGYVSNPQ